MKSYWKTTQVSEGELNYLDTCGDLTDAIQRGTAKVRRMASGHYELKRKMRKKVVEVPL